LRYAQNAYFDRSLVRALVNLLTEDGVVQTERLEKLWSERCQRDATEEDDVVRVVNHTTEQRAKDAARNQVQAAPDTDASPTGPRHHQADDDGSRKKSKQDTHHEFPPK